MRISDWSSDVCSSDLERIRLLKADGSEEHVKADEDAYSMGLDTNSEHDTPWLRYGYTSMTTPETTYELNVETGERRQLKQQPVLGYDASKYATERPWATARHGTKGPVPQNGRGTGRERRGQ